MTNKENELIGKIRDRAIASGLIKPSKSLEFIMDTELAYKHYNLDLEKLLGFDRFNFAHDVIEIQRHIDRKNKIFKKCFLPRSYRPNEGEM